MNQRRDVKPHHRAGGVPSLNAAKEAAKPDRSLTFFFLKGSLLTFVLKSGFLKGLSQNASEERL